MLSSVWIIRLYNLIILKMNHYSLHGKKLALTFSKKGHPHHYTVKKPKSLKLQRQLTWLCFFFPIESNERKIFFFQLLETFKRLNNISISVFQTRTSMDISLCSFYTTEICSCGSMFQNTFFLIKHFFIVFATVRHYGQINNQIVKREEKCILVGSL